MREFRRALVEAATQEYRAGNLSRLDLARVRMAAFLRPLAMREAQMAVADEAFAAGLVHDVGATEAFDFDWEKLIEFIKTILPLIIQIISLFT